MSMDAAASLGSELSIEAWAELPDDTPGELIDGRLTGEEMPTQIHEIVVLFLGSLLRSWLAPLGGFVGGSNARFEVAPGRGRKPDLYAFFPESKLPPASAPISHVPPDLMVEIVSGSPIDARRDRIEKLADYAQFGVRYYWIVDPGLRSLEILELGTTGRYEHAVTGMTGTVERVPGCDGLHLDLDALWAEVDRLVEASAR